MEPWKRYHCHCQVPATWYPATHMGSAAQCRLPTPLSRGVGVFFRLLCARDGGSRVDPPGSRIDPGRSEAHTAGVDPQGAELSSASSTLDEMIARVARSAEGLLARGEESQAHDLFEVERSLRAAQRRLVGVVDRMRRL